MNDYTAWNGEALTQGAADMRLAYRGIRDSLDDLEKALEAKLGQWDGDARAAYTEAKQQWNEGANGLNEILDRLNLAVENIHGNYSGAERANQGIFGG